MAQTTLVLGLALLFSMVKQGYSVAGTFDSSNIRSIKTEVGRIKDMSETIANEIKRQREVTTALQNEFKVFNADIKWIKKALADLDNFLNKTIANDTQFIREKVAEFGSVGQVKNVNVRSSQKERGNPTNNLGSTSNTVTPTSTINGVNKGTGDSNKGAGASSVVPTVANKESGTTTTTTTTTSTTEISKMLKLFQG